MVPVEGVLVLFVMLLMTPIAAFVGFKIAKTIRGRRNGRRDGRAKPSLDDKARFAVIAIGLCLASTLVTGAILQPIAEQLDIPGFGIGAATFLGPPVWWIVVSCVVHVVIQTGVATLVGLLMFSGRESE